MDEETKKLIAENYALTKDNNVMLKKLMLIQKWNQIYRIVYWSIIILSAIGAFYFIKQYMGSIIGLYTGGVGNTTDVSSMFSNKNQMEDLIKSLNSN